MGRRLRRLEAAPLFEPCHLGATTGLIVSEGQGYLFNPGICTPAQLSGWRLTTQSVHATGAPLFAQIWHVDRVSHTSTQDHGQAPVSANASEAGFDSVDIDDANGYLLEQSINPLANGRSNHDAADTTAHRLGFALEVVAAVGARIGRDKVGIRIAPYGQLFDMPHYDDIGATCVHVMDQSG